jgi:hypothetical protein
MDGSFHYSIQNRKRSRVAPRGATPEPPKSNPPAPDPGHPWPLPSPAPAVVAAPGPSNGGGHGGRPPLPSLRAERRRLLGRGEASGPVGGRRFSGPRRRWRCGGGVPRRWRCHLAEGSMAAARAASGPDLGPAGRGRCKLGQLVAVYAVATEVMAARFDRPCRGGAGF